METTLTEKDKFHKLIELAVKNGYWFDEDYPKDRDGVHWEVEGEETDVRGVSLYWNEADQTPSFFCTLEILFDADFLKAIVGDEQIETGWDGRFNIYDPKYEIIAHQLLDTHLEGGDIVSELYDIVFN